MSHIAIPEIPAHAPVEVESAGEAYDVRPSTPPSDPAARPVVEVDTPPNALSQFHANVSDDGDNNSEEYDSEELVEDDDDVGQGIASLTALLGRPRGHNTLVSQVDNGGVDDDKADDQNTAGKRTSKGKGSSGKGKKTGDPKQNSEGQEGAQKQSGKQ